MTRHITVAVCTALLILMGGGSALACDTGSWLMVSGWTQPGSPVRLTGGGLDAGAVLLVWDRSSGRVVGRGDVQGDGRLDTQVRVPLGAASGRHKIIALPVGGGTSAVEQHAWTDVIVGAPAAQAPAVTAHDAPAQPQRATPLAAALTVVAGAALMLVVRRRRLRAEVTCDADLDAELRMLVDQLPESEKNFEFARESR